MAMGTFAAVAINLAVAGVSLWVAGRTPARSDEAAPSGGETVEAEDGSRWTIYVTIALSGAGALGAEVVWTRLMGMLLGATVYVFSVILAVFLIGLAIGSLCGSWLLRVTSRERRWLVPDPAGRRPLRGPPGSSPTRCRSGPSTPC